jgi:hypothetical protein
MQYSIIVRRYVLLAGVVAVLSAAVFIACSVDSSLTCGEACADAQVSTEAACDFVATCADAGIPQGWSPVAAFPTSANPQCPTGFSAYAPALATGAPTDCCSCKPSGKWACVGTISVGTSNACDAATTTFSNANACVTLDASATAFMVSSDLSDASPTCVATSGQGSVDVTQAFMCLPNCGVDLCGAAPDSFEVCVFHEGIAACPAGFPQPSLAGANLGVQCGGCDCAMNTPSACTFTTEAFSGPGCTDAASAAYASSVCRNPSGVGSIGSVQYNATLPSASCTAIVDASITMTNQVTICCH